MDAVTREPQLRPEACVPVDAGVRLQNPSPWRTLAGWPARRWLVAAASAVATVLVIGIPTAMIPTPIFGREIATTSWAWPVLALTALLGGLILATYVRGGADAPQGSGAGTAGGLLAYFAVGCPVCNKLALLALGYTGALQWFGAAQPILAVAGIALLVWALWKRLQGEVSCPVRPA